MALTNEDIQAIGELVSNTVKNAKNEILNSIYATKMELYKEIIICEKDLEKIAGAFS